MTFTFTTEVDICILAVCSKVLTTQPKAAVANQINMHRACDSKSPVVVERLGICFVMGKRHVVAGTGKDTIEI